MSRFNRICWIVVGVAVGTAITLTALFVFTISQDRDLDWEPPEDETYCTPFVISSDMIAPALTVGSTICVRNGYAQTSFKDLRRSHHDRCN